MWIECSICSPHRKKARSREAAVTRSTSADSRKNPDSFLGTKNPALQLGRALKNGYLKWRGGRQLARLERAGK